MTQNEVNLETPKLSILVSAHNSEATIQETLQSIPIEDSRIELVLVDDGSTDSTLNIMKNFQEKSSRNRIQIYSTPNLGSANARNIGIHNAIGEWLIFLDSDDKLVRLTVDAFLDNSNCFKHIHAIRYSYQTVEGNSFPGKINELDFKEIMRQRGFWRYVYRKSYLQNNNLYFLPTFSDVNGFYVLDDWYFLLTFLATSPALSGSDYVLYLYNNYQRSPTEEFSRYRMQIEREYLAFRSLGKSLKDINGANLLFISEILYSRTYMITQLLEPSPSKTSKVQLIIVFLSIQSRIKLVSKFMTKGFFLLLRVLIQKKQEKR